MHRVQSQWQSSQCLFISYRSERDRGRGGEQGKEYDGTFWSSHGAAKTEKQAANQEELIARNRIKRKRRRRHGRTKHTHTNTNIYIYKQWSCIDTATVRCAPSNTLNFPIFRSLFLSLPVVWRCLWRQLVCFCTR